MATVDGVMTSRVIFSRVAPVADFPWPLAMAASMEALGNPAAWCKFLMLCSIGGIIPRYVPFFAVCNIVANLGFVFGSPP